MADQLSHSARRAARHSAEHATRVVFFIAGLGMAAWAPLVPYAKQRLNLGDGTLGLVLLSMGIGSVVAMPIAGALAGRFGCRAVIIAAAMLLCGALPFLATVTILPALVLALFGFGAGLGGIVGSSGVSGVLGLGMSPLAAEMCVVGTGAVALGWTAPRLLPYASGGAGSMLTIPRGAVLFIGFLCFIGFLTEGSVLDWSGVFLITVRGEEPYYAGLAFACFSATMTLGRLVGDRLVRRFGGPAVITFGGLGAAVGLAMVVFIPSLAAVLAGYALVGAGCSNVVPVLFTSVGRQTDMPESIAVPAVTALGYAGILAGPAAIGLVASALSLSTAFLLLVALQLVVAASGRRLRG